MCNCKKNKRVETQVIMGTPEPLPQEIVELTDEEIEAYVEKKKFMGEFTKPKEGTQQNKAMEFEDSIDQLDSTSQKPYSTSESPRNNINSVQTNNYVTNINSKSGTRNTESTLEKMNRSSFA